VIALVEDAEDYSADPIEFLVKNDIRCCGYPVD